ncbi:hypothetical protein XFF6990_90232 [Xanthomonas citri pv. fuscans]|nr:hypothetical protein XFF6990_90232 [Xanthomonas citri pv. fuscans]
MASVGIVLRADECLYELREDWVPEPLGSRADVLAAIGSCIPADDVTVKLNFRVEEPEDSEQSRTISVSGVWGQRDSAILHRLCNLLGARF